MPDRSTQARIAALERWARTEDRTAATEPARLGVRAKIARELDPDGTLAATDPAGLERRVNNAMKARMLRLSLKSAKARRARKAA